MNKMKLAGLALLALSFGLGGTSALAKGHDQGVADGPRTLVNTGLFSRGGGVLRMVLRDRGQTYGNFVAARVAKLKEAEGRPGVRPISIPGRNKL